MSFFLILAGVLAGSIFFYLLFALLFPDKLQ